MEYQNGEQTVDQNFDMSFEQYLEQSMEDFITACGQRYCLWCGRPVIYAGTGRHGVFCSKRCRWAFDKHRERERMKERKREEEKAHEQAGYQNIQNCGSEPREIQPEKEAETGR